MKTEDETGTILFKKFRYRKAENLGQIELSKSGVFVRSQTCVILIII